MYTEPSSYKVFLNISLALLIAQGQCSTTTLAAEAPCAIHLRPLLPSMDSRAALRQCCYRVNLLYLFCICICICIDLDRGLRLSSPPTYCHLDQPFLVVLTLTERLHNTRQLLLPTLTNFFMLLGYGNLEDCLQRAKKRCCLD